MAIWTAASAAANPSEKELNSCAKVHYGQLSVFKLCPRCHHEIERVFLQTAGDVKFRCMSCGFWALLNTWRPYAGESLGSIRTYSSGITSPRPVFEVRIEKDEHG